MWHDGASKEAVLPVPVASVSRACSFPSRTVCWRGSGAGRRLRTCTQVYFTDSKRVIPSRTMGNGDTRRIFI